MPKKVQRIDITGQSFGRLVVVNFSHVDNRRRAIWTCACDCGKQSDVPGVMLRSGHTQSCGCLGDEVKKRGTKLRHGKTKTPAWLSWVNLINRCNNETSSRWKNYGGRGISVCERWGEFENFYADMGDPPLGYTIERIDVNGDYRPENCKWVPPADQYLNKTTTLMVEMYGVKIPFIWLVRRSGVKHATAYARIRQYGWTTERAFPSITEDDVKRYTNLKPEDLHHGPHADAPRRA